MRIEDLHDSGLSIKLCACYSRAKQADGRLQTLSSDIALTSNVLRQLGDNIRQDDQARLYSGEALTTTKGILQECESVFGKIRDATDGLEQDLTKPLFDRVARRLKFMTIEKDLSFLQCTLERPKSTMLLLLNVIMYAGQVLGRVVSRSTAARILI